MKLDSEKMLMFVLLFMFLKYKGMLSDGDEAGEEVGVEVFPEALGASFIELDGYGEECRTLTEMAQKVISEEFDIDIPYDSDGASLFFVRMGEKGNEQEWKSFRQLIQEAEANEQPA